MTGSVKFTSGKTSPAPMVRPKPQVTGAGLTEDELLGVGKSQRGKALRHCWILLLRPPQSFAGERFGVGSGSRHPDRPVHGVSRWDLMITQRKSR